MKKNLEILKIEPKLDKNEKKYWRVNTNDGWMTCWSEEVNNKLKEHLDGVVSVEVTEKDGMNFKGEPMVFKNITECYDEVDKIETQKIPSKSNNFTTMYVSYAKDIFCDSLIDARESNVRNLSEKNVTELMQRSIGLVKQAKEAFE